MKLIKIIVTLVLFLITINLYINHNIKEKIFVKTSNNNKEIKGCNNYSI